MPVNSNDMLDRVGTVQSMRDGIAILAFGPASGCASCAHGRGCGIGPLVSLFRSTRVDAMQLSVPVGHLRIGDRVKVRLSGAGLIRAAGIAYILPLAGLFGGAAISGAVFSGAGDLAQVSGAGIGLATSWLVMNCIQKISGDIQVCVPCVIPD
jgi:sigma-E factor negative regulatory protein RseC